MYIVYRAFSCAS